MKFAICSLEKQFNQDGLTANDVYLEESYKKNYIL